MCLSWIEDHSGPAGSRQGRNDLNETGYSGPCPSAGTHTYSFRVFALDTILGLPADASKYDLQYAMAGHILADAELQCQYTK